MRRFNIGNASDIGQRKGEKKYEPVGEQREIDEWQRVSVLRKQGNSLTDVHMKIINDHRKE